MKRDTAYNTTLGMAIPTKPIEDAIREVLVTTPLSKTKLNFRSNGNGWYEPAFITGAYDQDAKVPLFTHPISIQTHKGEKYLVTDLRLFLTKDPDPENIQRSVRSLTDFNLAKAKALLTMKWLNGDMDEMRIGMSFAGDVFSGWIAESISKSYQLDFQDLSRIKILALVYYYLLFSEEEFRPNDVNRDIVMHVVKSTKLPAETVYAVVEKIENLNTIADLCRNIVTVCENVRLKDFNLAMLLTIVGNSWYGANAKENIAVALEHPPTWIAIVYTALTERLFKTSKVYSLAEQYGRRGRADEFKKNFIRYMHDNMAVDPLNRLKDF